MARRLRPRGEWFTFGPLEPPGFPPRHVRAYVPHGHPRDGTRPALYMFDGQNLYGDEGSFAGGWHAHDAVDSIGVRGHHVPVIVAIDNSERRIDELSAWPHPKVGGGQAEAFLGWVTGTVVPMIEDELGTIRGPVGAVIGGSSMGGLAALWAHFRYPHVFGGALAMSSAFFFGKGALHDFLREQPEPPYSRIYLDAGAKEGGGRMLPSSEKVVQLLRARGYGPDRLMWKADARGTHNESAWRRRLPHALQFIFKRAKRQPLRRG